MARRADTRAASPLRPPRTGLIVSARVSDSVASDVAGRSRWGNGVDWLPELHPTTSEGFGARAAACVDGDALNPGADDKPTAESADPFIVYALDWCSVMGSWDERDWQGRARRLLEATQSQSIAAEFWRGAVSAAETLSNTWLAKNGYTDVTGGAKKPLQALALLDDAVCDSLANGEGMIHCSPQVLVHLVATQALRREGALWRTANDTIVCADAGYDGTDKNETGAWMFASTVPEIILGPVEVTDLSQGAVDLGLASRNDVVVYAQRDVLVIHEPHLLHAAAQLDLA